MTLFYDGREIRSVAKVDCQRCHGTGFCMEVKHDNQKTTLQYGECKCIKVRVYEREGK